MVADPLVGSVVGGYRIVSLIARGGMGAVYLAQDPRLDRRVAVKVPAPDLVADSEFRERFLRESRLAASLEHQSIVPVYDAGEDDGRLYLALRYIEGADLAALIADQGVSFPQDRLALILRQIASALDAAHAHGLVHRDVKPGNILVGNGDQAYLSDFGLTKRRGSGSGLTRTGQFVGTLDYVAPEMIEGQELTGAADQYSLACVALEALTGDPPFKRNTDAATLYAHLNETPSSVRTSRPEISSSVDEVLRRGMAKRPEDRFPSCRALVEALARSLDAPSAVVAGRRRWMIAAALALVAAVAIVVLVLGGDDRQATPRTSASAPPADAADETRLLGWIPSAIRASCEATQPGELLPPASVASMTCVDDDVTVTYSQFDSARAMDDWFNQSIGIAQAFPGDCASDRKAEGTYTIDLVPAGRVMCFVDDRSSHVEWTDDGLFVHASASRDDLADQDLYQWWAEEAGPLEEAKDVLELESIPNGDYTMMIVRGDRDEYAASHDFPLLTEWFGRWILHLEGGEYQVEAPSASFTDQGTYVSSKGHHVVFEIDLFTCDGSTDTFEWGVHGRILRLLRSHQAPDCVLADPPPWDIHPWRQID